MKTITRNRSIALATLAAVGATTFGGVAVQPASADANTWKKVAIGAGIVTAYGLISGKDNVAAIGGLATAGSYLKYQSDKKDEDRRDDWYDRGRDNNRYGNYNGGGYYNWNNRDNRGGFDRHDDRDNRGGFGNQNYRGDHDRR